MVKKMLKSKDAVYYQEILKIKDQLYYTCSQGEWASEGAEPSKVYLYCENGKDVKKYNASADLHHVVHDGTKIAYRHIDMTKTKIFYFFMIWKVEKREK